MIVVLPAPLAPISVTTCPSGTARLDALHRVGPSVADHQVLDLEAAHPAPRTPAFAPAASRAATLCPRYASITPGSCRACSGGPR